jgi:hypothetical protein
MDIKNKEIKEKIEKVLKKIIICKATSLVKI